MDVQELLKGFNIGDVWSNDAVVEGPLDTYLWENVIPGGGQQRIGGSSRSWATSGGDNLSGWSMWIVHEYVDSTSGTDYLFRTFVHSEGSVNVKEISSFPSGVTIDNVTQRWYHKSDTLAYVFHTKSSGSSTVPAVYVWNSTTFDAGTTVLPAGTYGSAIS